MTRRKNMLLKIIYSFNSCHFETVSPKHNFISFQWVNPWSSDLQWGPMLVLPKTNFELVLVFQHKLMMHETLKNKIIFRKRYQQFILYFDVILILQWVLEWSELKKSDITSHLSPFMKVVATCMVTFSDM